ncbi:hypothetical protein MMC25_004194 [Agyrium rufum]|nr:hypothetical protein [Agyrium rufum]
MAPKHKLRAAKVSRRQIFSEISHNTGSGTGDQESSDSEYRRNVPSRGRWHRPATPERTKEEHNVEDGPPRKRRGKKKAALQKQRSSLRTSRVEEEPSCSISGEQSQNVPDGPQGLPTSGDNLSEVQDLKFTSDEPVLRVCHDHGTEEVSQSYLDVDDQLGQNPENAVSDSIEAFPPFNAHRFEQPSHHHTANDSDSFESPAFVVSASQIRILDNLSAAGMFPDWDYGPLNGGVPTTLTIKLRWHDIDGYYPPLGDGGMKRFYVPQIQTNDSLPDETKLRLSPSWGPIRRLDITTSWRNLTLRDASILHVISVILPAVLEEVAAKDLSDLEAELLPDVISMHPTLASNNNSVLKQYSPTITFSSRDLYRILLEVLRSPSPSSHCDLYGLSSEYLSGLIHLYLIHLDCLDHRKDSIGNDTLMSLELCRNSSSWAEDRGTQTLIGYPVPCPDHISFSLLNTSLREGDRLVLLPHFERGVECSWDGHTFSVEYIIKDKPRWIREDEDENSASRFVGEIPDDFIATHQLVPGMRDHEAYCILRLEMIAIVRYNHEISGACLQRTVRTNIDIIVRPKDYALETLLVNPDLVPLRHMDSVADNLADKGIDGVPNPCSANTYLKESVHGPSRFDSNVDCSADILGLYESRLNQFEVRVEHPLTGMIHRLDVRGFVDYPCGIHPVYNFRGVRLRSPSYTGSARVIEILGQKVQSWAGVPTGIVLEDQIDGTLVTFIKDNDGHVNYGKPLLVTMGEHWQRDHEAEKTERAALDDDSVDDDQALETTENSSSTPEPRDNTEGGGEKKLSDSVDESQDIDPDCRYVQRSIALNNDEPRIVEPTFALAGLLDPEMILRKTEEQLRIAKQLHAQQEALWEAEREVQRAQRQIDSEYKINQEELDFHATCDTTSDKLRCSEYNGSNRFQLLQTPRHSSAETTTQEGQQCSASAAGPSGNTNAAGPFHGGRANALEQSDVPFSPYGFAGQWGQSHGYEERSRHVAVGDQAQLTALAHPQQTVGCTPRRNGYHHLSDDTESGNDAATTLVPQSRDCWDFWTAHRGSNIGAIRFSQSPSEASLCTMRGSPSDTPVSRPDSGAAIHRFASYIGQKGLGARVTSGQSSYPNTEVGPSDLHRSTSYASSQTTTEAGPSGTNSYGRSLFDFNVTNMNRGPSPGPDTVSICHLAVFRANSGPAIRQTSGGSSLAWNTNQIVTRPDSSDHRRGLVNDSEQFSFDGGDDQPGQFHRARFTGSNRTNHVPPSTPVREPNNVWQCLRSEIHSEGRSDGRRPMRSSDEITVGVLTSDEEALLDSDDGEDGVGTPHGSDLGDDVLVAGSARAETFVDQGFTGHGDAEDEEQEESDHSMEMGISGW